MTEDELHALHPDQMSLPITVTCKPVPDTGMWCCPQCTTSAPPRETPAGVWCQRCHLKLETCCEGAPLPPAS